MKESLKIQLPWPPTANTYWRRNGNCYFISKKGIEYRRYVAIETIKFRNYFSSEDRIKIVINAYPPDNRKRDLDNILKCLQDSLQYAQIFKDDNQIDEIYIKRMPFKGNTVDIILSSI